MGKYVLKRVLLALLTTFIILSLTFILIKLLPIDKFVGKPEQRIAYYEEQVRLGYMSSAKRNAPTKLPWILSLSPTVALRITTPYRS